MNKLRNKITHLTNTNERNGKNDWQTLIDCRIYLAVLFYYNEKPIFPIYNNNFVVLESNEKSNEKYFDIANKLFKKNAYIFSKNPCYFSSVLKYTSQTGYFGKLKNYWVKFFIAIWKLVHFINPYDNEMNFAIVKYKYAPVPKRKLPTWMEQIKSLTFV